MAEMLYQYSLQDITSSFHLQMFQTCETFFLFVFPVLLPSCVFFFFVFFVLKKGQRGIKFAQELMISGHSLPPTWRVEQEEDHWLAHSLKTLQRLTEASRDCDVSLLVREGLGVRPALEVAYIYTHNVPLPLLFRLLN